jgi:hypothetical protein
VACTLSEEVARLRRCRSLYFSVDSASPTLISLCEAFLLFSASPAPFLVAFERFEWISLLCQVLEVDRSRAAELVLRTFSNCAQSSCDIARCLCDPPVFDRIRACSDSSSVALKQHSLLCLSCLCDRETTGAFADTLFRVLAGTIPSPPFFEIAVVHDSLSIVRILS